MTQPTAIPYRNIRCMSRRVASAITPNLVENRLSHPVPTLPLRGEVPVSMFKRFVDDELQFHRVTNRARPLLLAVPSVEALEQVTVARNPHAGRGAVGHTRRTTRHPDSNCGVTA